MKKILSLLILGLIVTNLFAQEQPKSTNFSEEKNVFKVNALSLLIGTGSIFYERKLNDMFSAQMGAAYLSYTFGDTKFTGLILTPEVKLYVKKNAIDGFYLAPYLRYQRFNLTVENEGMPNDEATYNNFGGGLSIGRQWIFNSGFTLDFFFGGHYGSGKVSGNNSSGEDFETERFEGFRPRVGLALGFAF
ncbi:MAG: DUF3575 domain-containing protein [Tenuifilaceae bacterium]|jgi:hypothetical protein|nr:DUF3575 domain-containing protein [Tenuifilaceae bacterium]